MINSRTSILEDENLKYLKNFLEDFKKFVSISFDFNLLLNEGFR